MIARHADHPVADYAAVLSAGAQFVDVREPEEFASGSLPGATNIPLGQLNHRLDELDPKHRVVVLCRSGGRSTQAAQALTAAGFGDIVNLAGGMLAFQEAHIS